MYTPSLQNYPDLLHWIHYRFDGKNRHGYLYGTPPADLMERQILVKKITHLIRIYLSEHIQSGILVEEPGTCIFSSIHPPMIVTTDLNEMHPIFNNLHCPYSFYCRLCYRNQHTFWIFRLLLAIFLISLIWVRREFMYIITLLVLYKMYTINNNN